MKFRNILLLLVLVLTLLPMSAAPIAAQDADPFPITIEHQFGSTTITEKPERIVAIGYTEQDFLLALGITPVAIRYWYGDESNAVFPWAIEKVEGELPVVLNMAFGELNYEAILELQPDLISAVTAGITEEEYDLLSQIAPTIAQSGDYINFGMPWQEVMQLIGDSVGQSEEATAIVAEVESLFTDAIANNPEFEGKTVAPAYYYDSNYGIYTDQDSRGRFFADLGFVIPDEIVQIAGESFYSNISIERMDLLDQDLLAIINLQFIEGGRATLESNPLYASLSVVKDGRTIYLDENSENALGFSSPLSLPYALNAVLPQLEAIFGSPDSDTAQADTCQDGFRLFDHEYLGSDPVCIPENPQRIAVLDLALLEIPLIQGIEPVAMYAYGRDLIVRSNHNSNIDIMGITANSADVGDSTTVNFEALLASNPDLILASQASIAGPGIELFQEIAPTLSFAYPLSDSEYRSSVEFITAALNIPEVGDEILAGLDARLADFQELVGESHEISLVRLRDALVLFVSGSFGDHLIHEAGLIRPEQQQDYDLDFVLNENNGRYGITVSQEELPLLDAEYIVIWTASPSADVEAEAQAVIDTLLEDPLWKTLQAVKDNHLFIVGSHWQGFGILEAHAALDDLFRYVAGVDPQEVSPNPFVTVE